MKVTEERRREWRERALMDQVAGFGLGWPAVVLALLEEAEGWAAYAAEQERHAETTARLERLRDGVAHLHDVYAVAPNEPRCCSDCAANDISTDLRRLLADAATAYERIPLARLKESNPARWRDMCECGHAVHDHSASNVVGCYWCECDVDA